MYNQCHHYIYHGYDDSDQELDHQNNDDDQYKYDVSYVKIILSSQFIAGNLSVYFFASLVSLSYSFFWNHQCHHYSDHGHNHTDQGLDHYNNNDNQHTYDVSYVKLI